MDVVGGSGGGLISFLAIVVVVVVVVVVAVPLVVGLVATLPLPFSNDAESVGLFDFFVVEVDDDSGEDDLGRWGATLVC